MMKFVNKLLKTGCALIVSVQAAFAQSAQQQGIASTTQILDTSVLFAIGAREAEQAIRGSFGWPTFQEGFVDRVYFRFDPDGYARFSTSPRLDEDVFEVICAESSTACIAKKPSLDVGLTVEGKIQIKIAGITPEDSFFVSDRKSELPLPPTVLEPLDARLETLLASGGHLLVKREVETVQEISLAGFSAVATYLRWVAQNQSPRVFPRGWPVPAQVQAQHVGRLTQPGAWTAPSAGPQRSQTTFGQATSSGGFGNSQVQQPPQTAFGTDAQVEGGVRVQQVGFGAQGAGDAQAAIQALQQELAELRAAQVNSVPLGNTQVNQNNAQLQDDFAKGFAQQAQARNLPLPVGYGAPQDNQSGVDYGASNLRADGGDVGATRNQNHANAPQGSFGTGVNAQVFESRIYALEVAVNELRKTVIAEMQTLKWTQDQTADGTPAKQQPATTPTKVSETEKPSMDALEELLLERLGQREPAPQQPIAAGANEQDTDRSLVMKLLKQLEDGPAVNEAQEEPRPTVADPPEEQPQEGFVTLSDYINDMLKSESANGQSQ